MGGASLQDSAGDGAGPRPSGRRAGRGESARAGRERAWESAEPSGAERCERSAWAAAAAAARAMAPAGDREGYWGRTTSTLDWCEENYAVTWYIAEFCECDRRPRAPPGAGAGLRGDSA